LNIHFGTWCHEDDPSHIFNNLLLLLGQVVKHGIRGLVIGHVQHLFYIVVILIKEVVILECLFDSIDECWDVIKADLSIGEVPVGGWVRLQVDRAVLLTVRDASVVREPDIVASLPQLDRQRQASLIWIILEEPGICAHINTVVQEERLLHVTFLSLLDSDLQS